MHDTLKSAIPNFQDYQPPQPPRRKARWLDPICDWVAKTPVRVDPEGCRSVLKMQEPRAPYKRKAYSPVDKALRRKIKAEVARGAKLHRLAVAYSINAIAARHGLTRGQVQAACRR